MYLKEEKMKGIILTSHGRFAEGLLDTLTIFSGEIKQIEALCLPPQEDIAEFANKLKDAIDRVNEGDGVVVFCDLLFGTPCNCSAKLLSNPMYGDDVSVITGMNLSMVLEFVGARDSGMDREAIVQTGQMGIVDFNKMLAERKG